MEISLLFYPFISTVVADDMKNSLCLMSFTFTISCDLNGEHVCPSWSIATSNTISSRHLLSLPRLLGRFRMRHNRLELQSPKHRQ